MPVERHYGEAKIKNKTVNNRERLLTKHESY